MLCHSPACPAAPVRSAVWSAAAMCSAAARCAGSVPAYRCATTSAPEPPPPLPQRRVPMCSASAVSRWCPSPRPGRSAAAVPAHHRSTERCSGPCSGRSRQGARRLPAAAFRPIARRPVPVSLPHSDSLLRQTVPCTLLLSQGMRSFCKICCASIFLAR